MLGKSVITYQKEGKNRFYQFLRMVMLNTSTTLRSILWKAQNVHEVKVRIQNLDNTLVLGKLF